MNKRIAIFGKTFDQQYINQLEELISELEKENVEIIIFDGFYSRIENHITLNPNIKRFRYHKELIGNVDYLISVGGDGTLLDTIALIRDSGIPILGINFGRLGFLSSANRNELKVAIKDLLSGNYNIDKRDLLHLNTNDQLFEELNFALNELSISKNYPAKILNISVWVNDKFLTTYWADGLIISTPTGSTAYSMSCGGAIMSPESQDFIIVPIANHNLNVHPIIIPNSSKIKIKIEGRITNFIISLDSRSELISDTIELEVYKENFSINLIRMKNEDFFSTIRNKLNWGVDSRN